MKATLSWSDGTICERSKRRLAESEPVAQQQQQQQQQHQQEQTVQTFNNRLIEKCDTIHSRDTNVARREDVYMKIASREMFNKINQNPFLLGNDYVSDIVMQDQYMKGSTKETKVPLRGTVSSPSSP